MGGFKEYDKYDAVGLAELVRKRKVSPLELCEEAIARIEKQNPALNAVIYTMYDDARRAARGPLPKGPCRRAPLPVCLFFSKTSYRRLRERLSPSGAGPGKTTCPTTTASTSAASRTPGW